LEASLKNTTLTAAAAALLTVLALTPAFADEMSSGAMAANQQMATYACRPAASGEKPSAMMGSTSLVCKPLAVEMRGSDGKMHVMGSLKVKPAAGPDISGLTPAQVNDAYIKWFREQFSIGGNS
jgi:hypothetical protein